MYPTQILDPDEGNCLVLFNTYIQLYNTRHPLLVFGAKGRTLVDLRTEDFLTTAELANANGTVSYSDCDKGCNWW